MPGKQREVVFRFLAEPTDVNFGGKVHGGAVMKWIDQAGYACAAAWTGRYCVTAYVGGIQFERPVGIGNLVEVRAHVVHTGRNSVHVAVDVSAREATHETGEATTHCLMVFVAMDEHRNPVEVPAFVPQTDEEKELNAYAQTMIRMRKEVEQERARWLAQMNRLP
jgi:acyl-CoA hydrolase